MKKVAVFTGTRAEYGLLYWLMTALRESSDFDLQVIAAAMHLSPEFGETWRQIEADGFQIDAKVEMLLSSNTATGVAKSMGLGAIGFADALARLEPDWLVLLGDRFEALAIAQTALVMRIPIAHLHGGELTEGAYDDAIRHSLTKMANLHFPAAEPYRKRIIQMGEHPGTVVNVGAPGLEHLKRTKLPGLSEISASLDVKLRQPYMLVTYHPVTSGEEDAAATTKALLAALDRRPDHQVILTYPNADNGGRVIISLIEAFGQEQPGRAIVVQSLGMARYLGLLSKAALVVGNSSSGIIEAPSFGVPTVNIGARQQGRLAAESVIHCGNDLYSISQAIDRALTPDFQAISRNVLNPYGQGETSARILAALATASPNASKQFFDIEFSIDG